MKIKKLGFFLRLNVQYKEGKGEMNDRCKGPHNE